MTTTVIHPSPGTTTDVIIRPAVVDGSSPSPPGRTQILRFPATGEFQNIQVQLPQQFQSPNPVPAQVPLPIPAKGGNLPSRPPPLSQTLQSYPVTIFPEKDPNQGQAAGMNQGLVPLKTQTAPRSPFSPYNFQSQRYPLPGLRSTIGTILPASLTTAGGGDLMEVEEEIITIDLSLTDPYASALKDTILGIQLLAEGPVVTSSALADPFDVLDNTEHIFIEPANNGEFSEGTNL